MEVLAQTWSEHCKHKIFASRIHYENKETGQREEVNNLYKTCIRDATAAIRKRLGDDDYCKSVFKDNAGRHRLHQRLRRLHQGGDPQQPLRPGPLRRRPHRYRGVNRDPMGTGMGAELVCNTDVFCFASPFYDKELPPRLLHPRRVLEGVREGVEHGGNKSGIPTDTAPWSSMNATWASPWSTAAPWV